MKQVAPCQFVVWEDTSKEDSAHLFLRFDAVATYLGETRMLGCCDLCVLLDCTKRLTVHMHSIAEGAYNQDLHCRHRCSRPFFAAWWGKQHSVWFDFGLRRGEKARHRFGNQGKGFHQQIATLYWIPGRKGRATACRRVGCAGSDEWYLGSARCATNSAGGEASGLGSSSVSGGGHPTTSRGSGHDGSLRVGEACSEGCYCRRGGRCRWTTRRRSRTAAH